MLQVAMMHGDLIDLALVFGGYPSNAEWLIQDAEAKAILCAPVPVDIVQYQDDYFCRPEKYPRWMEILQRDRDPKKTRILVEQGNHDSAFKDFSDTNTDLYERLRFWNSPRVGD